MKKILKLIFINILIFSLLILILEIGIWYCENKRLELLNDEIISEEGYQPFHPGIKDFELNFYYFPNEEKKYGRAPIGLNYKKKPIVIFGCSYAYGYMLDKTQSFSYKLSEASKRPVYNRAFTGWGAAHMLYQARKPIFYKQVPEPEYVIFVSMQDHFRRLYLITFMSLEMLNERFYLRYKEKNGEIIRIEDNNEFYNFIKRLYIFQKFYHFYVNNIKLKKDDYRNGYDLYFKEISESKKEMRKHWKNTKYVFVLYHSLKDEDILLNKLKENGFIVINLPKLTKENLLDGKYLLQNDFHPNEEAWNLLTPIIVKELNL